MASFAVGLARVALGLLPLPAGVRRRVLDLEPEILARLDDFARGLVSIGEQLQALAAVPQLPAAVEQPSSTPVAGGSAGPAPAPQATLVTFTVSHAGTLFGEQVFVAGDQEALGRWVVQRALQLSPQTSGADGAWSGLALLQSQRFQYKFLKWNPALPPETAQWELDQPEAGPNRDRAVTTVLAGAERFRRR